MTLDSPLSGQVFQRDLTNRALVPISGVCVTAPQRVSARFVAIEPGKGTTTEWQLLTVQGNRFQGDVIVAGGYYKLELFTTSDEVAEVARVGVGEEFIVGGHSVAAGGAFTIEGATDPRVMTIPRIPDESHYAGVTGDPAELPALAFIPYASDVRPGPFGTNTHFWAKFSEMIAQRENVPVLLLNAAFGGTTLLHWANSATGIPFDHSFVKFQAGMPYANLKNGFSKYLSHTGCRMILCDHGANDADRTDGEEAIFQNYKTWITQIRTDSGIPYMAVMVNRCTPYRTVDMIRRVQERVISEVENCYAGPDYDTGIDLQTETVDKVHFTLAGMRKAAVLWANQVSSQVLSTVKPFVLKPIPVDSVSKTPTNADQIKMTPDIGNGLTTTTTTTKAETNKGLKLALVALGVVISGIVLSVVVLRMALNRH